MLFLVFVIRLLIQLLVAGLQLWRVEVAESLLCFIPMIGIDRKFFFDKALIDAHCLQKLVYAH